MGKEDVNKILLGFNDVTSRQYKIEGSQYVLNSIKYILENEEGNKTVCKAMALVIKHYVKIEVKDHVDDRNETASVLVVDINGIPSAVEDAIVQRRTRILEKRMEEKAARDQLIIEGLNSELELSK